LAVSAVRNLLFGNGGLGGQDLIARDVQRDRDNGIPDYNTLRVDLGLPAITSFSQISSDPTVVSELEQAYPGGVNTIDAFEGGMAEDPVAGSDVGPLFQKIIIDQFTRLRDGDQFFYLNESWNRDELRIFSQGNTLSEITAANTGMTNVQSDMFVYDPTISGRVLGGGNIGGTVNHHFFGRGWGGAYYTGLAGWTVELLDGDGNVVQTATTSANGSYSFTDLALGSYQIQVDTATGWTPVSPTTWTVDMTKSTTQTVNFYNSADTGNGHHRHFAAAWTPDQTPNQQQVQWVARCNSTLD
jgi:hypothetical protein